MAKRKGLRRTEPPLGKGDALYRELWPVVDLAVALTFAEHADYLTDAGRAAAQVSINKRVVAAVRTWMRKTAGKEG
jgi:hypothetical protein